MQHSTRLGTLLHKLSRIDVRHSLIDCFTHTQIGGAYDRAEERYGFNKLFPFLAQDKSVQGGISAEDAQALALLNGETVTDEEAAVDIVNNEVTLYQKTR